MHEFYLARIFNEHKWYTEAANIVNLYKTRKWDQLALLRTEAKIHTIETYMQILAVIQLHTISFSAGMKVLKIFFFILVILVASYRYFFPL
jgi:hypothetical protein